MVAVAVGVAVAVVVAAVALVVVVGVVALVVVDVVLGFLDFFFFLLTGEAVASDFSRLVWRRNKDYDIKI